MQKIFKKKREGELAINKTNSHSILVSEFCKDACEIQTKQNMIGHKVNQYVIYLQPHICISSLLEFSVVFYI